MRHSFRGFTLVELMIVVVIVAILAAVAVPSYTNYTRRAHRSDAQNYLMSLAQANAQYFIDNRDYAGDVATLNSPVPASVVPYYGTPVITPSTTPPPSFTIKVTPIGSQAADSCGWLQIDSAGTKSAQGSDCW